MAEAIGSRGLGVGVICSSNRRQSVTIILPGERLEASHVQARWSDGTTDEYRFHVEGNGHLVGSASSADFQQMIDKLRRLNSVTLRVTRSNGQGFEDTVGLSGSSLAIGQITCGGPRESRRVDRSASVCDQVRVVGESSQDANRVRRFCRSIGVRIRASSAGASLDERARSRRQGLPAPRSGGGATRRT